MKFKHFGLIIAASLAAGGLSAQPQAPVPYSNPVPAGMAGGAPAPNVAPTHTVTITNVVVLSNAPPGSTAVGAGMASGMTATNLAPGQTVAVTNSVVLPSDVNTIPEVITPTNQLRMNFHDAPLNTVLTYLSKRMGLVIVSDAEVHGTTTIVSEQPVHTDEVIQLLSAALAKNNYSVSVNGRILTIATVDNARNGSQTPVVQAESPAEIPINDQVATVILPVHTLNPVQLIKDLDQLIPQGATVAANEAGNAVIITARQRDIHRFAEIISALDSSSVSQVGVYILKYADSKAVASELKEVFQSPDSSVARSDQRQRFRGFGGFGGFGGGGGGESGSSDSKNASNKAVFVSDDQMNAVVAAAPPDYFRMITNIITQLDQPVQDITVIRDFKLKYADATEMADELSSLFGDDTTKSSSEQSTRTAGSRFFTPPWMQSRSSSSTSSSPSDRMKQQSSVRVVPDLRTASIIVTASKDMMDQIAGIVADLDHDPAMAKHVYSFDLDAADPVTVQATMTALFAGQNTRTPQNNTASALEQRVQTAAQQQTTSSTSGFGSSGFGSGSVR